MLNASNNIYQWVMGTNRSHKGKIDAYDDGEKAPESIAKPQPTQEIQEQLPDKLDNPFQTTLFPYLSNKDLVSFSMSSRQFNSWARFENKQRATSALLLAVAQGNEDEAKRLLTLDPSRLKNKNAVAPEYSGLLIKELTPFQAALCRGDVEMCEMMKPFFAQLENGQAELQRQYDEIFPNGIEARVAQQQKEVFDFTPILDVIKHASDDDVQTALNKEFDNENSLNLALNQFREQFQNKSFSEMIFNPYHLLRAYQMYNDEFDNLATWDKRDLFWRQVIGFVQRYLPACYAQAFASGLDGILYNHAPLSRSFKFKYKNAVAVFPLSMGSGLGYDWAAGAFGAPLAQPHCLGAPEALGVLSWKSYVEQKHQAYKNYSRRGGASPSGGA